MNKTRHIQLPFTNARFKTITNNKIGAGIGAVLLDGGMGGKSSYHSLDDYIETTGMDPYKNINNISGKGLSDRISKKLSALNIEKPKKGIKKKNIVIDF